MLFSFLRFFCCSIFPSFSSYLSFFFFCSSSRPSRRQNLQKHRRAVPFVKIKFFFCEKRFLGLGGQGGGRGVFGNAHLKLTALPCFSFSFLIFSIVVFLRNMFLVFSCMSFKYVLLLALVSELNCRCFLRSRCSMVMWCPDDIGRDSWEWVGPSTWERACFNYPEWGGSSSLVETEPPQIVLLLLFLTDTCLEERHVYTVTNRRN